MTDTNNKTNISIRKPMDSSAPWRTSLVVTTTVNGKTSELQNRTTSIGLDTGSKDPVHTAIKKHFIASLKQSHRQWRRNSRRKMWEPLWRTPTSSDKWSISVNIKGAIFLISKDKRYSLNGTTLKLEEIANVLSRILFKSCFTDDVEAIYKHYFSISETPDIVKYVVENRVPYYFYDDYTRHDVRLNVVRTGDSEFAIEIGDGFWGNISTKNLESFAEFYVNNRKTKWAYTSPHKMYSTLVGKEPKTSELKVMVAFLKQNRKQDIVAKRAEKLVEDLVEQFPNRLKISRNKNNQVTEMLVVGKGYDWKLTTSGGNSRTQAVSTYVWQPRKTPVLDDEGNSLKTEDGNKLYKHVEYGWKGSICIDNINENTPVGDQFASRALALINDEFTIKMVSTISSYLHTGADEVRIINENKEMNDDADEMH